MFDRDPRLVFFFLFFTFMLPPVRLLRFPFLMVSFFKIIPGFCFFPRFKIKLPSPVRFSGDVTLGSIVHPYKRTVVPLTSGYLVYVLVNEATESLFIYYDRAAVDHRRMCVVDGPIRLVTNESDRLPLADRRV